jgi:hypothetical protein
MIRRVIIESPYRALTAALSRRNITYAVSAMQDSIRRGEAPFLSHLLYTRALDDDRAVERTLGISLGYAWWDAAEAICFYCDLGWSDGMVDAKLQAESRHLVIEERYLRGE